MKTSFLLVVACLGLAGTSLPSAASAQSFSRGDDQRSARQAMMDGKVMPFSVIKRRVEQAMGDATYVGMADPPSPGVYQLQFLHPGGVVEWVYVDGKTGDIIARKRQRGGR